MWLDAVRLNARNPPKAFNIGDAPGCDAWYYHQFHIGFFLPLFGSPCKACTFCCSRLNRSLAEDACWSVTRPTWPELMAAKFALLLQFGRPGPLLWPLVALN